MKKIIIFICFVCLSIFLVGCTETGPISRGKSAYEIAVDNGFVGTEAEWLESLKGQNGESLQIKDIYDVALENGFEGDFDAFLKAYFNDTDINGKSAYEIAVEAGFQGTEEEWLESLKGQTGAQGPQGDTIDLYEIYLKLIELGDINCSFLEFVQDYLNVDLNTSNQQTISKAILSAVKIVTSNDVLYDQFGNPNPNATGRSGAGVIYKLDKEKGNAYIITNYHVIYDGDVTNKPFTGIYVNLIGDQYVKNAMKAKYIGGSATYDIAVIYIENSDVLKTADVHPITVADSNKIVAGITAIAIGNPKGEGIAVTQGIVSVDSEEIYMDPISENATINENGEVEMRVIRIDTPVNPGNSGGGLFNEKGELIGIVNAKIISTEVDSFGYAIPSNIATFIAEKLISNYDGKNSVSLTKCLIGITITVTGSSAAYDPATGKTSIYETIQIVEVSPTSVLYGKVQAGDIITSLTFNGRTFEATRDFVVLDACILAEVGTNAQLTVLRNNQELTFNFTFANQTTIG